MLRERRTPPPDIFPVDPWKIEAARLDPKLADAFVGQAETMFALSNGYLGVRGTLDEGAPVREPGVYLNGFYDHRPITYGETAYGFPSMGQSMLNCPDGTVMKLFIDEEPFVVTEADVLSFRRVLDLQSGTLNREVVWITPLGKRMRLRTTRLVSFAHRHLAAIEYELTPEDDDIEVRISSELVDRQLVPATERDPRLGANVLGRVLQPAGSDHAGLRAILSFRTQFSDLVLGCGMDHVIDAGRAFSAEARCDDDGATVAIDVAGERGKPIRIWKYLSYHYAASADATAIRNQTAMTLDNAMRSGFAALHERQRSDVGRFWSRADVEVEGDRPRTQQVIRWNLFQLMQASERSEGHGIGARGLTGRTYEGHYFWDTEIYVLPFLVYTNPRIARSILKHRHNGLDKARARARELGHRGATFPWRTINGEEASAYYAAGTAQYHINADIAYAVRKYVGISGDIDFLWRYGAEILVETARLWCDLGFFSERKGGRFCINGVTGPDEYNAVVNNNYFTNIMARDHLRYAVRTVRDMERDQPRAFAELVRCTGLGSDELLGWQTAADLMYLPVDERLGVHPQDDAFLDREIWDLGNTPEEHFPLLLHYHPLNLYRSQVIKQADTLLAMFLLNEAFTPADKKRNFDYYDPLTTHDSSLSVCIQSIIANEIGYRDKALHYFEFASVMDLSDVGGNMMHGAHIASIGGTWMALVYGFAGLRDGDGIISFRPCLPTEWRRLRFSLMVRGRRLQVSIDHGAVTYSLVEGDELAFGHDGETIMLTSAAPSISRPTTRVPEQSEQAPGTSNRTPEP